MCVYLTLSCLSLQLAERPVIEMLLRAPCVLQVIVLEYLGDDYLNEILCNLLPRVLLGIVRGYCALELEELQKIEDERLNWVRHAQTQPVNFRLGELAGRGQAAQRAAFYLEAGVEATVPFTDPRRPFRPLSPQEVDELLDAFSPPKASTETEKPPD